MSKIEQLQKQVAELNEKNSSLESQIKSATGEKSYMERAKETAHQAHEDAAAKIRELTTENERLNNMVTYLQDKIHALTDKASEALGFSKEKAEEAKEKACDAKEAAQDKAESTLDSAKEMAVDAKDKAYDAASQARDKAGEAMETAKVKAKGLGKHIYTLKTFDVNISP